MGKQIYYKIIHSCGLMQLFSIVETSFGGPAENFVKHAPFADELRKYAEKQGWKEWTGDWPL